MIELNIANPHEFKEDNTDDLMFATNWTRAFKIHEQFIKWLNAYAIINEIAAGKILKKFMKKQFQIRDNLLDKIINELIKQYEFVKRRNIVAFNEDLIRVYAEYFTKGNIKKAKKVLKGDKFLVSTKDLGIVTFLSGGSLFILMFTLVICYMEDPVLFRDQITQTTIKAFTPVVRLLFFLIYTMYMIGVVIRVFREKEINFLHIFEVSYDKRIYEWEFWKIGSVFLFFWSSFFSINFFQTIFHL